MKFTIAALIMSAPITAMATTVFQTFGTLPVTFGGSGIPNNAVAASSVFVNGSDQITLGLTAHGRYSNPTVTNNGAGVFYAGSGSNCGIATDPVGCPSASQGALWNFGFFVGVSGPSHLSDYNFNLYYDFNPGANTPVGSLGVINVNNAIIAGGGNPSTMTVTQDSQNLLFSSFSVSIPGVITAPGGAFNPNALGEYSFYLTATTNTAFPAAVGTVGIDVQVVPVPTAAWLLGSGLIGLAGIARKRKPV
ncbi:hypothetical protein SCD_n01182 [Sulfuricella denitrificans skB26]|uniref:IPTL-CTERM protein sorting domain-containing protein n=2 Tax=Sulfuricella denitrificans TaxID=649841 RepID=S6B2W3_SULDS|nr:hypothetical protein SCD_n01182 [Sulfuricella denitrificans skB26]